MVCPFNIGLSAFICIQLPKEVASMLLLMSMVFVLPRIAVGHPGQAIICSLSDSSLLPYVIPSMLISLSPSLGWWWVG